MPGWTVLPFVVFLLLIAVLPLAAPRFWHPNRNKLILSLLVSAPMVAYLLVAVDRSERWIADAALEYAAFIALMGALFVITGGIRIKGSLSGNTAILGLGALIASFIGTTGASMLLIRPLLRANETRVRKAHVVIFFIFVVSNSGGLLTPLGDPPLYLGFLRHVPFLWTFRLVVPWLLVNALLLAVFHLVDRRMGPIPTPATREPLGIEGGHNFLWLVGLILLIFAAGRWGMSLTGSHEGLVAAQIAGFAALAAGSWFMTRPQVRASNRFTWGPVLEVAAIFIGIFATMIPALKIVEAEGSRLGLQSPREFFWATGLLSSVLDNAPTYLTFTTLATSVVNTTGAGLDAHDLGPLAAHPTGGALLAAISCGAVFFGAMTYIGNGPNFMVKAMAEENGVKMPSFFGFLLWSTIVLLPTFAIITFLFF